MTRVDRGSNVLGYPPDLLEQAMTMGRRGWVGIDEVGRGPLAGPVVAAAVVLRRDDRLPGVRDSKLVPERERDRLYDAIFAGAVAVGIAVVEAELIDQLNVLAATHLAMHRALGEVGPLDDLMVLVDGLPVPGLSGNPVAVVGGDDSCAAIAAASIVAKVTRDRLMRAHHVSYPDYGFDRHKGYGTAQHLRALSQYGPCALHRRTFRPVRERMVHSTDIRLAEASIDQPEAAFASISGCISE